MVKASCEALHPSSRYPLSHFFALSFSLLLLLLLVPISLDTYQYVMLSTVSVHNALR